MQQRPRIGGIGHIVDKEESLLRRRKYKVGCMVREQWVFGGYNCTDKVGFLVSVQQQNADTLLPIIEQYILPNTKIHSDLWRAYGGIQALPADYNQLKVNHSINFVDPVTDACTNHVENMWKNAKMSHKARCRTHRTLLPTYLKEFMWRERFGEITFRNIIEHITQRYQLP